MQEIASGLPVPLYTHLRGEVRTDALVQIPHTLQTIQQNLPGDQVPEDVPSVYYDDCRGDDNPPDYTPPWWKSTFVAANPAVAADFAANVLGASRLQCPYTLDAPVNCTSASWVELPGTKFQLHFVRASGFQRYPGEIDAYTQQVRSIRNITAGVFDRFMYNSLVLGVGSLDPFVERAQVLGLPFMVAQVALGQYAMFLDVPENDIIIQLRSDHVSEEVSMVPEMCTQQL